MTAGDYEQAMKYLELGRARDYYSTAFKRFRNEILTENANVFLTVAAAAIVVALVYKQVKKRRKGERRNG